MHIVRPTDKFFGGLQQRLKNGTEEPSPQRLVYALDTGTAKPSIFLRTSTRRITFVIRAYSPLRKQTTIKSIGEIGVDEAVTPRLIEKILNGAGREKENAGTKDRGEVQIDRRLTCRSLFEEYVAFPKVQTLRSFPRIKDLIDRYFLQRRTRDGKRFGDFPPTHFTQQEVTDWIVDLFNQHGPARAWQASSCVAAMFRKLQRTGKLKRDWQWPQPDRKDILPELQPRNLKISPDNLRRLWKATFAINERDGALVRMLILSAQRVGAVRLMEWAWIDFERRQINFPAAVMKGKRAYCFPITDPILIELRRLAEIRKSDFVFGTPKGTAIDMKNVIRIAERLDCAMTGAKFIGTGNRKGAPFKWNFHAFRSTALDLISNRDQTISKIHKKALLAHTLLQRSDPLNSYDDDDSYFFACHAAELLARRVMEIVNTEPLPPGAENGGNVVSLRKVA